MTLKNDESKSRTILNSIVLSIRKPRHSSLVEKIFHGRVKINPFGQYYIVQYVNR